MERKSLRSSLRKLWRWYDRINMMDVGQNFPITLVVHLTGKCNLNCGFCYIKNRDKVIDLDHQKLYEFIDNLNGLCAVELTGGEPCLHPKINEILFFLAGRRIKAGMFTNGLSLDKVYNLHLLDWLRVSINHYIDCDLDLKDPEHPRKFGYIYIKHKGSPRDWKSRIAKFMETHNGLYLKIAPDINEGKKIKNSFKDERIYIQEPVQSEPYEDLCYMGFIKPVLDNDGLVYPCVGTVKDFKRDVKTAITTIDHPFDLCIYHPIRMKCDNCNFVERNEFIKYILKEDVEDEDFI